MKHVHQFVGWSEVGNQLTKVLSLTSRYLELKIQELGSRVDPIEDIINSAYSALTKVDLEDRPYSFTTSYDDSELIICEEPVKIFQLLSPPGGERGYVVQFTIIEQIPASIVGDFSVYVLLNEDLVFQELREKPSTFYSVIYKNKKEEGK